MVDRVPEELWMEDNNTLEEEITKTIPKKKKCNKAKANRVLPRERTGHTKYPLPTTQEKSLHMDITRWSAPKSD